MARVAEIMTMTARAMPIEPAVEPAREKPLVQLVDVGELPEVREWNG